MHSRVSTHRLASPIIANRRRNVRTTTTYGHARSSAADAEYRMLAGALCQVLKAPGLDTRPFDTVQDSRAFYDGTHGLRLIAVTPSYWGEAWVYDATTRRASIHTLMLERGVVFEYDGATGHMRVLKHDHWSDDELEALHELF